MSNKSFAKWLNKFDMMLAAGSEEIDFLEENGDKASMRYLIL